MSSGEPTEQMNIRPTVATIEKIKQLADESGLSPNKWCVEILADAAERGVVVESVYRLKETNQGAYKAQNKRAG